MNKAQFWILNVVGGVCAILIVANLILAHNNEKSGTVLVSRQDELNRAQQVDGTMRNLALRIAAAGRTESALSNLLVRHDLKVNLPAEASTKPAP